VNKSFDIFVKALKDNIHNSLPGVEVQYRMAPLGRIKKPEINGKGKQPKRSAVIALLFNENEDLKLLLMKRAKDNTIHSSQISFPGGQEEPYDKNLVETALREVNEEFGIDRKKINIIGQLTPVYISVSNFYVYPFVAILKEKTKIKPNEEVQKVIVANINNLLKDDAKTVRNIKTPYADKLEAPCFIVEGEIVWGATAMMINELLELIKSVYI
jgi:8-oxo-dGTP pyrophosphatase MutT (NUDIX family)